MHVLVTRRLTLRRPVLADAEEIALQLSNWNVTCMLRPVPFPYRLADAEEWIAGLAERPDDLVYTIHRERLIGMVAIIAGSEPRIGYWLGEPWHGRGFMTEAAGKLLAHAFATRGYEAIRSSIFIDNPASLRVQQKLGFVVTGTGEAWSRPRAARVETWTTRLTASAFGEFSQTMRKSAA